MSLQTQSQKAAQTAYDRVAGYGDVHKEYASFARKFPSLIHTCGLAQAVAFAEAKGNNNQHIAGYLNDLAAVLMSTGHTEIQRSVELANQSRSVSLIGYLRLSRDAITAAGWLKRYVEALKKEEPCVNS